MRTKTAPGSRTDRVSRRKIRKLGWPSLLLCAAAPLAGCADMPMDMMPPPPPPMEDPGLPACSATMLMPQVTMTSMNVHGARFCMSPAADDMGVAPSVDLRPADALMLPGYMTLGPAVALYATGAMGRRGIDVLLPFDYSKI